jgi:hypothetical protein
MDEITLLEMTFDGRDGALGITFHPQTFRLVETVVEQKAKLVSHA